MVMDGSKLSPYSTNICSNPVRVVGWRRRLQRLSTFTPLAAIFHPAHIIVYVIYIPINYVKLEQHSFIWM